jgi:hypothetical protein
MADIDITQAEADALIEMEKRRADDTAVLFPIPGTRLSVALTSLDKRENHPRPDKTHEGHISKPRSPSDRSDAS